MKHLLVATIILGTAIVGTVSGQTCIAKDRAAICVEQRNTVETAWTGQRQVLVTVTQWNKRADSLVVKLRYTDRDGTKRTAVQVLDVMRTALQVQIGFQHHPEAFFLIAGEITGVSVEERRNPQEFEF